MTDSRTTELTAMERFRTALEKRGIEFETNDDECAEGEERMTVFKANLGESDSDILVTAKDLYFDGELMPWLNVEFHSALTPEQAVAATLGSERDEIELTQSYDAGFRNGVMAVFQQLEGIESYEELQDLIAEYWGEGEGNDER